MQDNKYIQNNKDMQNNKVIVDTSIWIQYFKNNKKYVTFIEDNLNLDNILITGLIISELLHGVKNEKEYMLLLNSISAVPCAECIYQDWLKTGEILFRLKKRGKTIPLSDALIAAIALRYGASVFTLDSHFKLIPQIKLI